MPGRSKYEMVLEWAKIVIERWQARMAALGVNSTGALMKSFEAQVALDAKGDPTKITFAFLYYGRFPDMGVGRGVTLSDVPDTSGRRKVKPWYGPTFMKEVEKLGIFLAAKYGYDAATVLAFRDSIGVAHNDVAWKIINR